MAAQKLEWDENKRKENLRKHGIDFNAAGEVFDRTYIEDFDADHSDVEDRWRLLGFMQGQPVVMIYTKRGENIRVISIRAAEKHEAQQYYEETFGDPL